MRKFISKIVVYSILLGGCLLAISLAVYHNDNGYYAYYEEEDILAKLDYFLTNKDQYNTVLIGSSKTYRHIDPLLFDSLTTYETSTYNLANSGLFPYRTYEVLDRVLEDNHSLEKVVLELSPIGINGANYNKKSVLYATNPERIINTLSMAGESRLSLLKRAQYILDYSKTFIYKYLGFGIRYQFEVASGVHPNPSHDVKLDAVIASRNGYLSLDDEVSLRGNKSVQKRHAEFVSNPIIVGGNLKTKAPDASRAMDKYTDFLVDYVALLEGKGITVLFYISPRWSHHNAQYLYDQKERLSKYASVIDLSSPEEYPVFYSTEYSHDRSHLNRAGARLVTAEVARQFNAYSALSHRVTAGYR